MAEEKQTPSVTELQDEIRRLKDEKERLIFEYEAKLSDEQLTSHILRDTLEETDKRLSEYATAYTETIRSTTWKLSKPIRFVSGKCRSAVKSNAMLRKLAKGVRLVLRHGIREAFKMVHRQVGMGTVQVCYAISDERRREEEETVFDRDITFSILVPLYNTPIRYLDDMIRSVQEQTYGKWELCLADGSDDAHGNVGERCAEYVRNDPRIVYKKLEKNMGISGNTNACIDMSTGNFISLFDHDDVLHPSALFETMKAICEHGADFVYTDEATFEGNNITNIITFHYKPDYAVDTLRANNYICHFSSFSRELLDKAGPFRHEYDGSQDHDMILRLTECAENVYHVRELLYFWRSHKASVASDINSKPYAIQAGQRAVHDSIVRTTGYECEVTSSKAFPTIYNIAYELKDKPLVSIIIPNCNHVDDLRRCVMSVVAKTTYPNYEILILENNSDEEEIFEYYKQLDQYHKIRILHYEGAFNYSDINNVGVKAAKGEYVLLLNNDISVITEDWIEQLLMYAQRDDVGAVGAKLLYPDKTIQHAGIILGLGADRTAGHEHYGLDYEHLGYMGRLYYARNTTAVTGACLLIRKSIYEEVGGLDTSFAVSYNDVDFCLRVRKKGYLNVFTPLAELYHYESASRGSDQSSKNRDRFLQEAEHFRTRWKDALEAGDPYYNPHFSLDHADFRLK